MLRARSKSGALLLSLALALGCAAKSTEPARPAALHSANHPASVSVSLAGAPSSASTDVGSTSSSEGEATLLITEPQTLRALEARGLTLTAMLGARPEAGRDNRALSALPAFRALAGVLKQEAKRASEADKLAGVDLARFSHRLFDVRFLSSENARFELAGVVNRLDRAPFVAGSCGETRLIYRLSYQHDPARASKLPMTLGIELLVPEPIGGCRGVARRWLEPRTASPNERAAWLSSESGPLAPARLLMTPDSARVVVNVQLVRWPATMRPDLGGHAEYLLRSFRLDQHNQLKPELLENTVQPDALLARGSLRKELVEWLRSSAGAAAVDSGSPILPARLLAERSISVTPRGLARLANRPFSSSLSPRDFDGLDWSKGSFVKSAAGLLRRLDQLSCPGCHESRSVAGFHLLGEDAPESPPENALASPLSAHVVEDLPRRARVLRQVLEGEAPDFTAPFAERANQDFGGYGAHCGLDTDPSFSRWSCAEGLVCSRIEAMATDSVGQCLPATRSVGDPCERGGVAPHRDRRRDRMSRVEIEPCEAAVCNRSSVGFPGGMCTASCDVPGSACGSIAILDPFNACLARGKGFLACIRTNVRPAGLRACDASHLCRDDYVCARASQGGVCIPPYFIFQLRVDGHDAAPH